MRVALRGGDTVRTVVVVVASDLVAAAEQFVEDRNGGPAFTVSLSRNGRDAHAYLASWWLDATYDPPWGDEDGRLDLRSLLEDHPALAGRLKTNLVDDGDGRFHAVAPGPMPAWAVYLGWDQPNILADLGVTRLQETV